MHTSLIIPAFNEQRSIGRVLSSVPSGTVHDIIVVDNGCTDGTAGEAARLGARVVREDRRGYGAACLAGIAALGPTECVVFLDADYSDHPEELPSVIHPIREGRADLVIGSRTLGKAEPGALLPQARFGNWLATQLIRLFYGARFTDLGPFRAIRADKLRELGMRDQDYGWTVEMQVKAVRHGLRTCEVPVSYRRRVGVSKITGTLKGTVLAGFKIIGTLLRYIR